MPRQAIEQKYVLVPDCDDDRTVWLPVGDKKVWSKSLSESSSCTECAGTRLRSIGLRRGCVRFFLDLLHGMLLQPESSKRSAGEL